MKPVRSIKSAAYALLPLIFVALINRPPATFASETNAVAGNTAFALDLYKQLNSGDGNLFFSPYSISTCLAMTYAGARGNTEAQMARTLHFGADQAQLHAAFGDLQKHLNDIQTKKEVELNIANGLWAQREHPFLPAFLDTATKDYAAKVEQVDFRTSFEAVRAQINDWVSDRTKGKIKDLIPAGALNGLTRLVLANAIYFKGKWQRPFEERFTATLPFYVTTNYLTQAKLMQRTDNFGYAETENLQLLEMDYAGRDISMVILLPKRSDGLKALEDSLNAAQLNAWIGQVRFREVHVFVPKFKLTQQFDLSRTLAAMGMADAFSPAADFSGMDGIKQNLYISSVVHKAFVEVDEQGTEAAAATGVMVKSMAVRRPEPPPTFRADHPFLFLLRDTHLGSILFLGRVTNPAK
ncbi:MAG TPA: serpin family protein [Candidatus Cybelea sp.]|jgi:serpin B|nr:serpin family protein [Candidatus Cybelea sp.]